jgi:D-serine deaminase-like pyridoxal phosphate-dependent protein
MGMSYPVTSIALPPAARPGDPLDRVDTPALLLELDAFERNVARMQAACSAAGVALRPHAKAHKTPAIALAQIRAGAVGVCCQKISEAIPFVEAGVRDIHISNEVGSPAKAALLAQLARHARMSVCVDHPAQIEWLAQALDTPLDVFIEINPGQNRCGVNDAEAVLRLLGPLQASPRLRFKGLQAYHGKVQHVRSRAERGEIARQAADRAASVVAALDARGVRCEVVTGGGTGSVEFDLAGGIYTEVQAGSYVFMDADYARNDYADAWRFEQALFLASRVMSVGDGSRIVLDAGLKSLAVDTGLPDVWERPLDYVSANDEHGIVNKRSPEAPHPALGDLLLLVPGHCDPTLNLHDELIAFRKGVVEAIWPVAARGLSR